MQSIVQVLRINNAGSKEQRGHKCHEITHTFKSYNLNLISLCAIVSLHSSMYARFGIYIGAARG